MRHGLCVSLPASEAKTVIQALARMGLIDAGEEPVLKALTGGVSSLIILADTVGGAVCVKRALPRLKVAREWLAPVVRALRANGEIERGTPDRGGARQTGVFYRRQRSSRAGVEPAKRIIGAKGCGRRAR